MGVLVFCNGSCSWLGMSSMLSAGDATDGARFETQEGAGRQFGKSRLPVILQILRENYLLYHKLSDTAVFTTTGTDY